MRRNTQSEEDREPQIESKTIRRILESKKKFVAFLDSKVKNKEIAEDLFQTSILKVLKNSEDLKNEQAVLPWFYQILRNATNDYFRENKKILQKSEEIKDFITELANEEAFYASSKEALCACFQELLKNLNPSYADILTQIDLSEGSLQELAQKEQISVNNMTVKLHRARQALRKSLEETCGSCTKHGCLNCTCNS